MKTYNVLQTLISWPEVTSLSQPVQCYREERESFLCVMGIGEPLKHRNKSRRWRRKQETDGGRKWGALESALAAFHSTAWGGGSHLKIFNNQLRFLRIRTGMDRFVFTLKQREIRMDLLRSFLTLYFSRIWKWTLQNSNSYFTYLQRHPYNSPILQAVLFPECYNLFPF